MNQAADTAKKEIAVPRDAATVLLLRDAPAGFEVFMVKRSGLSDVFGEAHVFPGGKVDAADSAEDVLARIHGMEEFDTGLLGEDLPPHRAAGMFVAAARETFEEAGVLLARGVEGDLDAARARLNQGASLAAVLGSLGAMLEVHELAPWVRWVTPEFVPKRFDARFFLALAPAAQVAMHDDFEATHSEWLRPADALARWAAGDIKLAPPTFMSLSHLAQFADAASAVADARTRRPPVVQPVGFKHGETRCLAFPGDAMHPVRERAIPFATRLIWDGSKFVPFD